MFINISFHIDKELTNDDRVIFADKLLHTKYNYRDGFSRKSTLRKFLSSYYGLTIAEELLNKFWETAKITLGDGGCLINISWKKEDKGFPVDNFIKFLGKVMPEINIKLSNVTDISRIELLKYAYAERIHSKDETETVTLSSELTEEETDALENLSNTMNNGNKYCFEHYICETCRSHDENHPWHLEFMPTYMKR